MATAAARPLVRRSRVERRVRYAREVLAVVVLAAIVLWGVVEFLGRIPAVMVIVVGAVFFTYLVYPVVRFFNTRGMPLLPAILVTYFLIAGLLVFGIAVVVPALAQDTTALVKATPEFVRNAQRYLANPADPITARLPPALRTFVVNVPAQLIEVARTYAGTAAAGVLAFIASIVGVLATVVVIPVLATYLMFEAPDIIAGLLRAVPRRARPKALAVMHDLDAVLGGFIRGQLAVGATIGVCITLALLVLHVKYAVLIGVMAGLFDIIPYVGAVVGFVPAVLLALLNGGWQHALIVGLVFALIFQAEGHFIAPRIVSDSVGLTPLMVIVAILIGGELLGVAGMFLAVPIAAILRVVMLHAVPALRKPLGPLPPAATTLEDDAQAVGIPSSRGPGAKKAERTHA